MNYQKSQVPKLNINRHTLLKKKERKKELKLKNKNQQNIHSQKENKRSNKQGNTRLDTLPPSSSTSSNAWPSGFSGLAANRRRLLVNGVIDAIGSQMINQILEHVHHIRTDVMKGYRTVRATVQSVLRVVVDVLPVPEILVDVVGYEMVLGHEGKETSSSVWIARVHRTHTHALEALAHLDVLGTTAVLTAMRAIRQALDDELAQTLSAKYVAGAAAHIALLNERLEAATEVEWVRGRVR